MLRLCIKLSKKRYTDRIPWGVLRWTCIPKVEGKQRGWWQELSDQDLEQLRERELVYNIESMWST